MSSWITRSFDVCAQDGEVRWKEEELGGEEEKKVVCDVLARAVAGVHP